MAFGMFWSSDDTSSGFTKNSHHNHFIILYYHRLTILKITHFVIIRIPKTHPSLEPVFIWNLQQLHIKLRESIMYTSLSHKQENRQPIYCWWRHPLQLYWIISNIERIYDPYITQDVMVAHYYLFLGSMCSFNLLDIRSPFGGTWERKNPCVNTRQEATDILESPSLDYGGPLRLYKTN